MLNFFDRIYLMMTFTTEEWRKSLTSSLWILALVAVSSLVFKSLGLLATVNLWSVLVALVLHLGFYFYIKSVALNIDWELLREVEEAAKRKPVAEKPQAEEEVQEAPTNDAIVMEEVDPDEDLEFTFEETLGQLFKNGTAKEITAGAVDAMPSKVRKMNGVI